MMDRRAFIGSLAGGLLAAPLAAEAQQVGKVYRVGVLWLNSLQVEPHLHEAFRQGLREFVGVEDRNIVIEFRSADGNADKLPGLVAELLRLKVDVIVADVTPEIRAAKQGTSTVPIVMAIAADPVGSGLPDIPWHTPMLKAIDAALRRWDSKLCRSRRGVLTSSRGRSPR